MEKEVMVTVMEVMIELSTFKKISQIKAAVTFIMVKYVKMVPMLCQVWVSQVVCENLTGVRPCL